MSWLNFGIDSESPAREIHCAIYKLLSRDSLAGVRVAARVAAWQQVSADTHRLEIQKMLEEAHPWGVPSAAHQPSAAVAGPALPFDVVAVGDSTWRRLPEVECSGRRSGTACALGGSMTMEYEGRPPALLTLQRLRVI